MPFLMHWVAGDPLFDQFLDLQSTPPGASLLADLGESS
jgi:hypothetical protein